MNGKRILSWLLVLMMLVGMIPGAALAATGQTPPAHTHQWTSLDSDMVEWWHGGPTCTEGDHYMVWCTICDQYNVWTTKEGDVPPLGHDWGPWVVDQESTCTTQGLRHHTCNRCGEVERERAPLAPHDYQWTVTRQATCAKEGERTGKCRNCGKTTTETIGKTAHTWGEWYILTEATAWTAGIREHKCQVCGLTEQQEYYLPGTVLPGDRGGNVQYLQELLNAAGFNCGKADGINGGNTQNAIKQAEAASGHPATGIGWTGLISWLEGQTGGSVPKPSAGAALTLIVAQISAQQEKYYLGDVIDFSVNAKNTGTVTFGSVTLYAVGANSTKGMGNYDSLHEVGQTTPGNGVSTSQTYTITQEDVNRGYVTLVWEAQGYVGPGDVCTSGQKTVTLPTAPGANPDGPVDGPALVLTVTDTGGQHEEPYHAGETVNFLVTLKNTGTVNFPSATVYRTGDNSSTGAGTYDPVDGSSFDLQPGWRMESTDSYTFTAEDEARGYVTFTWVGHGFISEGNIAASNTVTFTVKVGDQPEPVSTAAIEAAWHDVDGGGHPGEAKKTLIEITNVGEEPLNIVGYAARSEGGQSMEGIEGYTEWSYSSENVDTHNFLPGQRFFIDYYITPTDADADAGYSKRSFTVTAESLGTPGTIVEDTDEMWLPVEKGGSPELSFSAEIVYGEKETYEVGDQVIIRLTAANTGTVPLAGVTICATGEDVHPEEESEVLGEYSPEVPEGEDGSDMNFMEPNVYYFIDWTVVIDEEMAADGVVYLGYGAYGWYVTEGDERFIDGGSDGFELPVTPAPAGNASLILVGQITEGDQEIFQVGDEVTFSATITNNGEVPIVGVTVVATGENDFSEDPANEDLILGEYYPEIPEGEDAGDMNFMEPGEAMTVTQTFTITEEMVQDGIVYVCFEGFGWYITDADEQLVNANTLSFELPVGESEASVAIAVSKMNPVQTGLVGEKIPFRLVVTNTGKTPLMLSKLYAEDKDGAKTGEKMDPDGGASLEDSEEALVFLPGEFFYLDYEIELTQADLDAGAIWRDAIVIATEMAEQEIGYLNTGHQVSDHAEIEIPLELLNPFEYNPALQLELLPGQQEPRSYGEEFDIYYRVTNTGTVPMELYSVEFVNGDGKDGQLLEIVGGWAANASWLEPGDSFTLVLRTKVTKDDVDRGEIVRIASVGGFNCYDQSQPVFSNEVMFEADINDSGIHLYAAGLTVTAEDTSTWAYRVGDTVTVHFLVENKSKYTLSVYSYEWMYADDTYCNEDAFGPWIPTMAPGDSFVFEMYVTVNDKDAKTGYVGRSLHLTPELAEHTEDTVIVNSTGKVPVSFRILEDGEEDEGDPPTLIPDEVGPKLVLAVTQVAPIKEKYAIGDEITFNWTLTNIGDEACTFGGIWYYTDPSHMIGSEIMLVDKDDGYILHPFGGSKSGTDTVTITHEMADTGIAYAIFEGYGLSMYEAAVFVSNRVPFDFPIGEGDTDDPPTRTDHTFVEVKKSEFSSRFFLYGYMKGETVVYEIVVTNVSDVPLYDIEVTDPLKGSNEDAVVDIIPLLNPGESYTCYFSHVVDDADVIRTYIENTATASWIDESTPTEEGTGARISAPSNTVIVPVIKNPIDLVTGEIVMTKAWYSPAYPHTDEFGQGYFMPGEKVTFAIQLYNSSDRTFYDIRVSDPLAQGEDKEIAFVPALAPGQSETVYFEYEVTGLDAAHGFVTNVAYAVGEDEWDGIFYFGSNPATVRAGFPKGFEGTPDPDPFGVITEVKAVKQVLGYPANHTDTEPGYYVEGEFIQYMITVTNTGEVPVTDVWVLGSLGGVNSSEIGHIDVLNPGESYNAFFNYKVTAKDVAKGYVLNVASAVFTVGGIYTDTVYTNQVISDTDGDPNTTFDPHDPFKGLDGEPCSLTLVSRGTGTAEYDRHICAQHYPVCQQVEQMLAGAKTVEERIATYKMARTMWQAELDKLYELVYEAMPDGEAKIVVLNERMLFYAQVKVYEDSLALIYPDDGETVARLIAEMMEKKCTGLCYEAHTAPAARVDSLLGEYGELPAVSGNPDCGWVLIEDKGADKRLGLLLCDEHAAVDQTLVSLLAIAEDDEERMAAFLKAQKGWQVQLDAYTNGRYRPAGKDERVIIAADRRTFDNWLIQRQKLLDLFYPEGLASVETLTREIMYRVIDNCQASPGPVR